MQSIVFAKRTLDTAVSVTGGEIRHGGRCVVQRIEGYPRSLALGTYLGRGPIFNPRQAVLYIGVGIVNGMLRAPHLANC